MTTRTWTRLERTVTRCAIEACRSAGHLVLQRSAFEELKCQPLSGCTESEAPRVCSAPPVSASQGRWPPCQCAASGTSTILGIFPMAPVAAGLQTLLRHCIGRTSNVCCWLLLPHPFLMPRLDLWGVSVTRPLCQGNNIHAVTETKNPCHYFAPARSGVTLCVEFRAVSYELWPFPWKGALWVLQGDGNLNIKRESMMRRAARTRALSFST